MKGPSLLLLGCVSGTAVRAELVPAEQPESDVRLADPQQPVVPSVRVSPDDHMGDAARNPLGWCLAEHAGHSLDIQVAGLGFEARVGVPHAEEACPPTTGAVVPVDEVSHPGRAEAEPVIAALAV